MTTRIILAVMCSGVAATAVPPRIGAAPGLIWNVSASVSIGLYLVTPPDRLRVTDLVVVEPPRAVADFLAERSYLPRGVPLLKRVLALSGQTVCRLEPRHHRRRNRGGSGARTRSPWTRASRLARLSQHSRRHDLRHELAVPELARRPLLRTDGNHLGRRPRDPSLDRRGDDGKMTAPFHRKRIVALPFAFRCDAFSLTAYVPNCLATIGVVAVIAASSLQFDAFARAKSASADSSPASRDTQAGIETFVEEAAKRFAVPARWIRAIMRVESSGYVRARSPKGAIGLMQIMPSTYDELRARHGLGADPFDPHDNILAGSAYIRELLDRYGSPNFLAAYNAGPARFDRYLTAGRALPAETLEYVEALAPMIAHGQLRGHVDGGPISFAGSDAPLFALHSDGNPTDGQSSFVLQPKGASTAPRIVDLSALVPHSNGLFVHVTGERELQ